ncbi:glycoside hydrolase family 95 protein [Thalassotalea sp. HSM 43]|uniref:glycoside hydrolase family 95 protein n=1 Tax=Thalassotalea sp. HSM 43 TaxID=2552945 RepID=UPI0010813534|nr:glycoside hydrolase family 95 protein [Thalassotalea sp. HSM 43]QBY04245.1 glycoside hydrolase family 95 protein [Thalassotalea sp. HSM 43]
MMSQTTSTLEQLVSGNHTKTWLLLISVLLSQCSFANDNSPYFDLWYQQPAKIWDHALPIGNGRLGAMVFGGIVQERLQLNEDTMWAGKPTDKYNKGSKQQLEFYRKALFSGDFKTVDDNIMKDFSIDMEPKRSHQTLGDLHINFAHGEQVSSYQRTLSLENAISTVQYQLDGSQYTRQTFASEPAQVMVTRITADTAKAISFNLVLSRPQDNGFETATVRNIGDDSLLMVGQVTQRGGLDPDHGAGVKFYNLVKIVAQGGKVFSEDNRLFVENADQVDIFIAANTNFYSELYQQHTHEQLNAAIGKGWSALKRQHIQDHQALFKRSALVMQTTANSVLATDQRLSKVQQGVEDPAFTALYYHYGRYLLIASSRVGSQPANLQGIWNRHIRAPWNADYHVNINLQMNYWPADIANLSELQQPLFAFIQRLAERGKQRAEHNFGVRGWVSPHATDIWASPWTRATKPHWGLSHVSNAWLMSHMVDSYQFSQDDEFLQSQVWPLLKQVCLFYFDWLVPHPDNGKLVSGPAASPENSYLVEEGGKLVARATTMGPAMDQQIIAQLFKNSLRLGKKLAVDDEFLTQLEQHYAKLSPGIRIDDTGRIMEWFYPYPEAEPGHRHISHVYALYPGNDIHPLITPEFAKAARNTIDFRLQHGGAATGWSRAWMINFMARLYDGQSAKQHLDVLYQRSTSSNLFDLHPPFQIDGNFGATAAIVEMLLQSHAGFIDLLPSLPKQWLNGEIRGIKARGDFELDINWQNGRLVGAHMRAGVSDKARVRYMGKHIQITNKDGEAVPVTHLQHGIVEFRTEANNVYKITMK